MFLFMKNGIEKLSASSFKKLIEKQEVGNPICDDVKEVSRGRNAFSKIALLLVLCLTEISGITSLSSASAVGNPLTSTSVADRKNVEQTLDSNSQTQENTNEQPNQNQSEREYINTTDANGMTPLHIAVEYGCKDMVNLLLEKGADVNAKDDLGCAPLHYAAKHFSQEIGEILISKGAYVNVVDGTGMTPLHYAAYYNRRFVGALLISKGADINKKDYSGCTPLHRAVKKNSANIVELLIINGANINEKNNQGKTPIDYYHNRNKQFS